MSVGVRFDLTVFEDVNLFGLDVVMEFLNFLTEKRYRHLIAICINDINREECAIRVFFCLECLDFSFFSDSSFEFAIFKVWTEIIELD